MNVVDFILNLNEYLTILMFSFTFVLIAVVQTLKINAETTKNKEVLYERMRVAISLNLKEKAKVATIDSNPVCPRRKDENIPNDIDIMMRLTKYIHLVTSKIRQCIVKLLGFKEAIIRRTVSSIYFKGGKISCVKLMLQN